MENESTIRLHALSSQLARRVSAYLNGFRPGKATLHTVEYPQELPDPTATLKQLFDCAIRTAKGRGRPRRFVRTFRILLGGYLDRKIPTLNRKLRDLGWGTLRFLFWFKLTANS